MVTSQRDRKGNPEYVPDYVTQSTAGLLSQMMDLTIMGDFPYSVNMIMCNGGIDPSLNDPALQLKQYFPVLATPNKTLVYTNYTQTKIYCLKCPQFN